MPTRGLKLFFVLNQLILYNQRMKELLKKPSAWIPMTMSAAAFLLIIGYVVMFGIVRHEDEGTPAHLFQILMGFQVFIIALFTAKWLPKKPKQAFGVLVLQGLAALIPLATLFFLESVLGAV